MNDTATAPKVNRATIEGRAVLEMAGDLTCPSCSTILRGIDAELLEVGVRLICRSCHRLVFSFEPIIR
jgi:hypothetical protein